MSAIHYTIFHSPAGALKIAETDGAIVMCDWLSNRCYEAACRRLAMCLGCKHQTIGKKVIADQKPAVFEEGTTELIARCVAQLKEYFRGERREFDIPVAMYGTDFQLAVWQTLTHIGYGETTSYGHIAAMIGRPKAVRAAANAIGANPISILVPCHRIIGSDGSPTGYAGGLEAKLRLLGIERCRK